MPKLSQASLDKLATCDQRLQDIANELIETYDFTVLEGHRNEEAQNAALHDGRSKLPWPQGKHNSLPSRAMDIAPYPVDWADTHRFAFMMGMVALIAAKRGIKVRFGMDWNQNGFVSDEKFKDFPHVEVLDP